MDVTFARTELPNRQKNHPNATFGIRSNTAPNTVVLLIHVAYKIKKSLSFPVVYLVMQKFQVHLNLVDRGTIIYDPFNGRYFCKDRIT